jgi:hypothetical protein
MQVKIGAPEFPYRDRPRRQSPSSILITALREIPTGSWVFVDLADLPGSTEREKLKSLGRRVRRELQPIQILTKGSLVYIRRVPDTSSFPAREDSKRPRPVFFRPPTNDRNPDRVAVA